MNCKYLLPIALGLCFFVPKTQAQEVKPQASINHLAIYVTDLQRSAAFYRDIIGLDTIPEPFHDGKHAWLRIGPHSALHIIQGADTPKTYFKNNHICFSVPSIENFTGKLKQNNIRWEDVKGQHNAITKRADGVLQLWMQDPDGYWIEINNDRF